MATHGLAGYSAALLRLGQSSAAPLKPLTAADLSREDLHKG